MKPESVVAREKPKYKLGYCVAHSEQGCKICRAEVVARESQHTPFPWVHNEVKQEHVIHGPEMKTLSFYERN